MIETSHPRATGAALIFITMTFAAPAGAHSGEIHSASAYDATETPFGSYDPALDPDRNIEVRMDDRMRFFPDHVEVRQNEVIRFTIVNDGELVHEFVLGTQTSLAEHAELMKKFPSMEHDEPYMVHVPPGESKQVTWRFDTAEVVSFGCLLPGHFDAGMKGTVEVR